MRTLRLVAESIVVYAIVHAMYELGIESAFPGATGVTVAS